MTRRPALVLAIVAITVFAVGVAVLGGPSSIPSPTPGDPPIQPPRAANRPVGGDPNLVAAIPEIRPARAAKPSTVHSLADGPPVRDADANLIQIEPGADLAVFEGPVVVGPASWYRVYVLPNVNQGPTEFFSWVLEDVVAFKDPVACPGGRGISVLGAVDPFTRARCVGAGSFVLRGWTWDRMLPSWYRIAPEWLGEQNGAIDSTISLNEDPRHPGAGAAGGGPFPFLDVQLPPGLERPPLEIEIDVAVHFGDPLSRECVRKTDPFRSLPDDELRNGPLWCATRLVVEGWTPLLGPEGRPFDPSAPQLHRHPDRGPGGGICAGVGMGPLVFRMDPTKLDPIWLESANQVGAGVGFGIIPNFDPGFRVVFTPDLAIVDERGEVVARNGTPVDPDGALAGHFICPTRRVVYFD